MPSLRVISVTGGAGFIGFHLCERLVASGYEVTCHDNFFAGRRENIAPHLYSRRFELGGAARRTRHS